MEQWILALAQAEAAVRTEIYGPWALAFVAVLAVFKDVVLKFLGMGQGNQEALTKALQELAVASREQVSASKDVQRALGHIFTELAIIKDRTPRGE